MSKTNKDGEKIKGLINGLQGKVEENEGKGENDEQITPEVEDTDTNKSEVLDIDSVFAPVERHKIINKGFTIREDQAKDLERYSKRAKKKESEFLRDALDLVFSMIKERENE